MANINDQRNQLRNDLLKAADTIAALRSKAAINDLNALKEMSHAAAELHRKAHALEHLLETEPEKVKVEVQVPVVVTPELPKAETIVEKKPEPVIVSTSPVASSGASRDLRSIIGLNEKLMIIRNLFGGDNAAFDSAIATLSNATSKTEAIAIARKMATDKGWKPDGEAFTTLISVINRRNS